MKKYNNFKINKDKSFAKVICNFFGNLFFTYCVIIALALILFSSVTIECEVRGSSMYPTLNSVSQTKNDIVFVNPYNKDLNYGDIVVVGLENENIIKRVVGLSGDTIDIVFDEYEYKLERNGKIIVENYINYTQNPTIPNDHKNGMHKTYENFQNLKENKPELFDNGKLVVPDNSIFVLGDNRSVSLDSSVYGTFDMSKFVGKVEKTLYASESEFSFYYYYILNGEFFVTLFSLF